MTRRSTILLALATASIAGTIALYLAGTTGVIEALQFAERNAVILTVAFAAWALVANCLILPAGTLSLIAGGAALGAVMPAAIWFAAQLITAPFLHRAGVFDRDRSEAILRHHLGPAAADLVAHAAADGVMTTIVLRLTPVLPSAPACLIAAAAGIELRPFMAGSILAGWVRPLYFSSLGASIGSIARVGAAQEALSIATLLPLAAVAACAAVMLAVRLLRRRAIAPRTAPAPAD